MIKRLYKVKQAFTFTFCIFSPHIFNKDIIMEQCQQLEKQDFDLKQNLPFLDGKQVSVCLSYFMLTSQDRRRHVQHRVWAVGTYVSRPWSRWFVCWGWAAGWRSRRCSSPCSWWWPFHPRSPRCCRSPGSDLQLRTARQKLGIRWETGD